MRLPEAVDLLDGVAAHGVRHVLLRVLEPRVEGRRLEKDNNVTTQGKTRNLFLLYLFGEGQIELLDLTELILDLEKSRLAVVRV